MIADLHTHSTASDGQHTPSELVYMAKNRGLAVLALTDHDTTAGLAEAVQAGEEQGVRVLRGIELSAKEYDTFHILGYQFSPDAPILVRLCQEMKERRDERVPRLMVFLQENGITLSENEVKELAGGSMIGRPHFAQTMVRKGYVKNNREAFDRYLDTEAYYQKVEQGKPPVRECIEAIQSAGGVTSLAHPYQIKIDDEALEHLIRKLCDYGLDAIECYYPRYSAEQQAFYLRLAEKYHLHITGGSDFHGEKVKPDISLSPLNLELSWLMDTFASG